MILYDKNYDNYLQPCKFIPLTVNEVSALAAMEIASNRDG